MDGKPLTKIRTRICYKTRKRYILWSDVLHYFEDIYHLKNDAGELVIFMVGEDDKL